MPAMVVNDDAGNLTPHGALRFFASKLAPTGARRAGQNRNETSRWDKKIKIKSQSNSNSNSNSNSEKAH